MSERGDFDMSCAMIDEDAGAGVEGRTGGEHVVDQYVLNFWIKNGIRGQSKGIFDILVTLTPVEAGLCLSKYGAHEAIFDGKRRMMGLSEHFGKVLALVVTALTFFGRMKWDRD